MPDRRYGFGRLAVGRSVQAVDASRRRPEAAIHPTVAQAVVAAIGEMHCYAAQKADTALATAQSLVQTAQRTGPLTAAQGAALYALRQEFLRALLLSVEASGVTLIDKLRHGQPRSQLAVQARQHIDQLVTWYVHHVRMILRR